MNDDCLGWLFTSRFEENVEEIIYIVREDCQTQHLNDSRSLKYWHRHYTESYAWGSWQQIFYAKIFPKFLTSSKWTQQGNLPDMLQELDGDSNLF